MCVCVIVRVRVGARALVYGCMCVALPIHHYLKNGTIFDKMFLNIKCVL